MASEQSRFLHGSHTHGATPTRRVQSTRAAYFKERDRRCALSLFVAVSCADGNCVTRRELCTTTTSQCLCWTLMKSSPECCLCTLAGGAASGATGSSERYGYNASPPDWDNPIGGVWEMNVAPLAPTIPEDLPPWAESLTKDLSQIICGVTCFVSRSATWCVWQAGAADVQ